MQTKMENHSFATYGTYMVTGLNLILGIMTNEAINWAVAGLGIITLVITNVYKITVAIIQLRDLRKNGWKLPEKTLPTDEAKPEKE
jgi:uncharacterized membrane protein YhaH (DUF805 family)